MTLWVRWKKRIMPLIELDPEDAKNAQDLDDVTTRDNYIRVEIPFNSLITEFFEASDRKLSWQKSLLVICKILGPFVNTLTLYVKYSLLNGYNIMQPIHMQLSKKKKPFS